MLLHVTSGYYMLLQVTTGFDNCYKLQHALRNHDSLLLFITVCYKQIQILMLVFFNHLPWDAQSKNTLFSSKIKSSNPQITQIPTHYSRLLNPRLRRTADTALYQKVCFSIFGSNKWCFQIWCWSTLACCSSGLVDPLSAGDYISQRQYERMKIYQFIGQFSILQRYFFKDSMHQIRVMDNWLV